MSLPNPYNILVLLSPFLASFLTYFFAIRKKRKIIDLAKERELNIVLANLLNVWHYVGKLNLIIQIMEDDNQKTIFPKKILPMIILNTKLLNDSCFQELDRSSEGLKKYDPIIFYELSDVGKNFDFIRKECIFPLLKNGTKEKDTLIKTVSPMIQGIMNDVQENLELVSVELGSKVVKKVKRLIKKRLAKGAQQFMKELDAAYYESIKKMLPPPYSELSFDAFKANVSDSPEFQRMIELDVNMTLEGNLDDVFSIISKKPNISIDELENEIKKMKQGKK